MAKAVVDWLVADEWEVYQEVSIGYACSRADIVAVKNGLSWIIETKVSYGLHQLQVQTQWGKFVCHWAPTYLVKSPLSCLTLADQDPPLLSTADPRLQVRVCCHNKKPPIPRTKVRRHLCSAYPRFTWLLLV